MENDFSETQELLRQKADLQARLKLLPYDGSPEIKEQNDKKYLYVRKRIGGKLTSKYVDIYSDELYQLLLRNAREARELNKQIRQIDKRLAQKGHNIEQLSSRVIQNIEFARVNMKANIYDQAILEGVATSFPQTEDIIENGIVSGMKPSDIQKILNLKHAWEFILDKDVITSPSNYYLLCHISKLVNEGFFQDGGRIRGVPVSIGGSSYIPPIPIEAVVKERIDEITHVKSDVIDIAIDLCLYCMKTQIFTDGNKRTSVIFANHFLISHGEGFLVIPEKHVSAFKKHLVKFYESENPKSISDFMKKNCWKRF